MILYDLKCEHDHVFEAWFKDSAAYEAQAAQGEVVCPVCGSQKVGKALMTPNVAIKKDAQPQQPPANEQIAEAQKLLAQMQKAVEENFDYVGKGFAEEARKIHYGETDPRAIYGEASAEEAKSLKEEGVEFTSIPWKQKADA